MVHPSRRLASRLASNGRRVLSQLCTATRPRNFLSLRQPASTWACPVPATMETQGFAAGAALVQQGPIVDAGIGAIAAISAGGVRPAGGEDELA